MLILIQRSRGRGAKKKDAKPTKLMQKNTIIIERDVKITSNLRLFSNLFNLKTKNRCNIEHEQATKNPYSRINLRSGGSGGLSGGPGKLADAILPLTEM